MASGMWKGAGYGAILFLVMAGVGALTPLRVPLLKVAGRDYAALQLQQRAADAAASSPAQVQAQAQVQAPDRERVAVRLEAWHKRNETLSLVGLLGWVLDVWPWLLGLGVGLPVLGALIGAQGGAQGGGAHGGAPAGVQSGASSRSVRGPATPSGPSPGIAFGASAGPRAPLATSINSISTPAAAAAAVPRPTVSPSPSAPLFGRDRTSPPRASTSVTASAPPPPHPLPSTEPVVESPVATASPGTPVEPAPGERAVTDGETGKSAGVSSPAVPDGDAPLVPAAPAASANPLPPSEWSWNARPAPRRAPGRPKPPPVESPNSDAV